MNRSRFLTLIAGGKKKPFDADRFVLLVDSEESGVTGSEQFEITGADVSTGTTFPVRFSPETDPFDFTDVTVDVSDPTITFPTAGKYFVQIASPFQRVIFGNGGDVEKIIKSPLQWGDIVWSSMGNAFWGASNMDDSKAKDAPNISNVALIDRAFQNSGFNVDISNWDVSNIRFMRDLFRGALINRNLGTWKIQSLEIASGIFRDSAMSSANYTDTLVGWINNAVDDGNVPLNTDFGTQTGMTFDRARSGGANFANAGAAIDFARTTLGWTITHTEVN